MATDTTDLSAPARGSSNADPSTPARGSSHPRDQIPLISPNPSHGSLEQPSLPSDQIPFIPPNPSAEHPFDTLIPPNPPVEQPVNNNDFPSKFLCPFLMNEPPVNGVTFDIPSVSLQVFEYASLYRFIYTTGTFHAFRSVRHPIASGKILRTLALPFVRRVPPEVQAVMNQERQRRGLSLEEGDPLNQSDHDKFIDTMVAVRSSILHRDEVMAQDDEAIEIGSSSDDSSSDDSSSDDSILDEINNRLHVRRRVTPVDNNAAASSGSTAAASNGRSSANSRNVRPRVAPVENNAADTSGSTAAASNGRSSANSNGIVIIQMISLAPVTRMCHNGLVSSSDFLKSNRIKRLGMLRHKWCGTREMKWWLVSLVARLLLDFRVMVVPKCGQRLQGTMAHPRCGDRLLVMSMLNQST
mmetsp:Transcript_21224/g.46047  ORF Transcript_21224/g.46047 Transcript_21224/m.46047 type:complete len:412 (+) Transcript_21224:246-1481(+)